MVSPLAPITSQIAQAPDPLQGLGQNLLGMRGQIIDQQAQEQAMSQQQQAFEQSQQQMSQQDAMRQAKFLNSLGRTLLQADESQWEGILTPHTGVLAQMGFDLAQLQNLDRNAIANVVAQTDAVLPKSAETETAGQKERADLIRDLESDNESVRKSAEIALGLSPRAVGSAIQTITESGSAEDIADTEATITQRKKFAELTGSSRAKKIDDGFEAIQGIDKNIRNIDSAIQAIDDGARTGVIESKFFPSLRASTLKLEQLQNELALDVIGSVTFGALSEGELKLARDTAIPRGLQEQDLRNYLSEKKSAQNKLRAYYQEQIDFLDQGGTIAGFLRSRERAGPHQGDMAQQQNQNLTPDSQQKQTFTSSSGIQFTVD